MQPLSEQDIDKYPYLRKISNFLSLSAILLLLTTTSPLVLFNLVPVQAQTTHLSFRTPTPADGSDGCMGGHATLTFDAQGTPSSSNPQHLDITSGTFTVTASDDAQKTYSGSFDSGSFTSNSGGGVEKFALGGTIDNVSNAAANCSIKDITFSMGAPCSTSNDGGASNPVTIGTHYVYQGQQAPVFNNFNGVVECSSQGGGTTTQFSSSMTGTTQDSNRDGDGDGIPDSSDRCPNNSHHRCFIEGDNTTTASTNQQ